MEYKLRQSPFAFYLFSRAGYISGVARIFDFTGALNRYNESKDTAEADRKATYLDWLAVGDDLRNSMNNYGSQEKT